MQGTKRTANKIWVVVGKGANEAIVTAELVARGTREPGLEGAQPAGMRRRMGAGWAAERVRITWPEVHGCGTSTDTARRWGGSLP